MCEFRYTHTKFIWEQPKHKSIYSKSWAYKLKEQWNYT